MKIIMLVSGRKKKERVQEDMSIGPTKGKLCCSLIDGIFFLRLVT